MLDEHRILQLKTLEGDSVEVEINFNEKVGDCKILRFRVGDKEFDIYRDELLSLMLVIGSADDQKRLMPAKVTNVRRMERLLRFQFPASKDYRKGETVEVVAPWIDEIPDAEEVFSGNVKNQRKIKNFIK